MARRPLRNIGILAHIDAGKTTLTENLLHLTGAVRYPGAVEHGSTATDWLVQEQERGITIASAAISCRWRQTDITIVDTPGHVDFTMEVERSLRVLDGAVLVISGPDGVQAQTETVWHQIYRRGVPTIGWVNKLDRPGFDDLILQRAIKDQLGIEPVPLYLSTARGDHLVAIDVLRGDALEWSLAGLVRRRRALFLRRPLEELEELRRREALERVIDVVASYDDAFAETVLDGDEPTLEQFRRALRRAMSAQACLPLVYGAARFGLGVELLADEIVALLPAPDEVPPPKIYDADTGERRGARGVGRDDPLAAFVFKTERRPRGERLAFVRVFGGQLAGDREILALSANETVRPTQIVQIMGGDSEPIDALSAGMIGGLLFEAAEECPATGETLIALEGGARFAFERIDAPKPVMAITLEAPDLSTHERMVAAFKELCADDPSLSLGVALDTGLSSLSGMGELQLALAVERVERAIGVALRTGRPIPRRRHLIEGVGEGSARLEDLRSGRGRVVVALRVRGLAGGGGESIRFEALAPRRRDWREAFEAGLRAAIGADGAGELDVVGAEITIQRLEVHGSDIAPVVFRDAARRALEEALDAAQVVAAEPWVALSVVVPEAQVGRVVGDLARRGARVRGSESRGQIQVLSAEGPLAQLIGYTSDLRSMTGGRGLCSLEPIGYEAIDGGAHA